MKRTRLAAVACGVMCFSFAQAARAQFPSCNVTLRSWLDLSAFTPVPANGNSCYGYVSPGGHEYALIGLENQLAVVRITDPDNPVIVGSISHSPSLWADVRTYGHHAYVSNESGGGLDVISLVNVDSNVVTLVQRFTGSGLNTIHSLDVNPASGYLYLAGSNLDPDGMGPLTYGSLVAVSLANPAAPVIAGQWTSGGSRYTHEPHVISYTSGPYADKEVAFCFNGGAGLRILDVTNKASMVPFGPDVTYPGLAYCHQGWTDPTRTYLYINDEIDDGFSPAPRTLIFNVSNLSAPVLLGTFTAGATATDHNLYWRDGFIFESNYKSGMRVIDAANPTALVEVGWFDSYPEFDGFGYNGNWNNFPYFPSGTVILSDIDRGLFVLDVSEALLGNLQFTFPNGLPALSDPSGGTTIRVNVSGLGAASPQPGTGILHYDVGSGFQSVPMSVVSPNVYDAVLPASPCGLRFSYYFSAETTAGGERSSPCSAPVQLHSALSASGFGTPVFQDNFETALAWTSGPNSATSGFFIRGNPIATPTGSQPEDDHTPGAGVNCMFTGQNPGGVEGAEDVDGGTVRIGSPTFDLSGGDAFVTYWRWYFERDDGDDPADGFVAEISNNNGASWVTIESLSPYGGLWEQVQFLASDLIPPTNQMKLRFSATDGTADGDIVEAAIDDVTVAPLQCPAIPAATVLAAGSRKANAGGPGGVCDIGLLPPRKSDPRSGGINQVRIAFSVPPAAPGGSGVTLDQATCAAPAFVPYAGASVVSGVVAASELVLSFSPALENGRTYRINIGPSLTSVAGQSVEVRGLVGDVDGNGQVNALDRSVVVGAWTGPGGFTCPTDIDSSGGTNGTDRSIVVGAWTGVANCAP